MEGKKNAAGLRARRESFMRPTTKSVPKQNKRRLARANASAAHARHSYVIGNSRRVT